jgi:hypothetical protein
MKTRSSRTIRPAALILGGIVILGLTASFSSLPVQTAQAEPPADQDYTGNKRCASCHFTEFMKWKKSPHSKAFDILTAKYQSDETCLPCHTTGYGKDTGFKDAASTPNLVAVGCESCHGPGSKHEEVAKPFAQTKNLTDEQKELINGTIWRVLPGNMCIECHKVQGHGDSQTPPELREG